MQDAEMTFKSSLFSFNRGGKNMKLKVDNLIINYMKVDEEDYISITDMLKSKDGYFFITDWLRNRNTIEFLGIWEELHNPNFNYGEFAIINELICLANLENINSIFINEGLSQSTRLERLNKIAISQMKILNKSEVFILKNNVK